MAEKKNGKGRGMGKGWTGEGDKKGNKGKRRAEGKERGIEEGKVRDRVQRGDDRRKPCKKDVQGRKLSERRGYTLKT